jgi:hypothetical protein
LNVIHLYFMGKPFERELETLPKTITWANELELGILPEMIAKYHHPVYIVGSGGSFSACIYAADLLTSRGVFAKAVTPLELFYAKPTLRNSNVIFISASGSNTDILFAFKKSIESEPISVVSICMRRNTKLASLSNNYSMCSNFEFDPPAGKDGFLATNSLMGFFVILYRAITNQTVQNTVQLLPGSFYLDFVKKLTKETCFVILYGSYHHSVAVDLESKFSEAGLAPSLLSDYRQFAHGRHQWFDKRKDSAIIALTCPADERLCNKTLQLLPQEIPIFTFYSKLDNFEGSIQLLLQSMSLIDYYGKKQHIDPGKPGVPEYGSKIYHLRYERLIADEQISLEDTAIVRKAKVNNITDLSKIEHDKWRESYKKFTARITGTKYGSLIFDYDGTLCSPANRFKGMSEATAALLINFLKKGFVLGIVSGRGKSLRTDLSNVFNNDPILMENVIVGYYNGSEISPLKNTNYPRKSEAMHPSLITVKNHLNKIGIRPDESPNQLTFVSTTTKDWNVLRATLLNEIMLLDLGDLTMVESSHSIDIVPRKIASKNNVLAYCKKLCAKRGLPTDALCIGDKGQWPGNDYALLANNFALSVGEVSTMPETGWNFSPPGVKDEKAVAHIFDKIQIKKGYFTLTEF